MKDRELHTTIEMALYKHGMEKKIKESEEWLSITLRSIGDAVIATDTTGCVIFMNPVADSLTGWKWEEAAGKPLKEVFNIINEETGKQVEDPVKKAIRAGIPVGLANHTVLIAKDGTKTPIELPVEDSCAPIRDDKGEIVGGVLVFRDITERKRAEEALQASRESFHNIVEKSADGILIVDRNGIVRFVNPEVESLFGSKAEEFVGELFGFPIVSGESLEIDIIRRGREIGTGEMRVVETSWGDESAYLISIRDITERTRADEQIKASLREKEVLLKEIYHRVKNNLQVVSSLLNLQSERIEDKNAAELFKISQNRIDSMALIHEELYQSEDLARVDFAEYIQKLVTELYSSYGVDCETIKLNINAANILLDINKAIPSGLIINELVSNSLKHAFPDGKEGELSVVLRSDNNQFTLTIRDTGVGFPDDLDFRNTASLGMQLVVTLTNQLDGTIELDRSGGTTFNITFAKL